MGFDIFASGTNNFSYKREGCEDGSTFNSALLIADLFALDTSTMQAAGKSYVSGKLDPTTDIHVNTVDLMLDIVRKEMIHNLSNAVCFLALNPHSSEGHIYLNATEINTFWTNTNRAAIYKFSPGVNPGAEFIACIGNCLKETSLDNWGVFQYLSLVLNKFYNEIDETMTPTINISLTN